MAPMEHRSGRIVKPTLDTSGDISFSDKRRAAAAAQLLRRLHEAESQRQRLLELERWRDEKQELDWATEWIRDHGGTIPKALKRTHPDTGGNDRDFQLTQRAREIIARPQRL